jgi:hypothetical protein
MPLQKIHQLFQRSLALAGGDISQSCIAIRKQRSPALPLQLLRCIIALIASDDRDFF